MKKQSQYELFQRLFKDDEKETTKCYKRKRKLVESSFELKRSMKYQDLTVRLYHDNKNDSFCLLILFNNRKLILKSIIEQNFNVYFENVECLKNLVIDNLTSFK
jgi:hypothetical protein